VRLPSSSTAVAMLFVAVVPLDMAVARQLFPLHLDMIAGIAPTCVLLQAGFFALFTGRREGAAFWAGFVICGSAVAMLFFCGLAFRESKLNNLLWRYYVVAWECLRTYIPGWGRLFNDRVTFFIRNIPIRMRGLLEFGFVSCVPQILSALVGGWLARGIARRHSRAGPSTLPPTNHPRRPEIDGSDSTIANSENWRRLEFSWPAYRDRIQSSP
jgi:hypothetical protein